MQNRKPLPLSGNHEKLAEAVYCRRDEVGGLWLLAHEDGEVDEAIYLDPSAVKRLSEILGFG
jgi:hypothetical protein